MDGLKGVVPDSCHVTSVCTNQKEIDEAKSDPVSLMYPDVAVPVPEPKYDTKECPGCVKNDILQHNGIPCLIRDWGKKDPITNENNRKIKFVDLLKS